MSIEVGEFLLAMGPYTYRVYLHGLNQMLTAQLANRVVCMSFKNCKYFIIMKLLRIMITPHFYNSEY